MQNLWVSQRENSIRSICDMVVVLELSTLELSCVLFCVHVMTDDGWIEMEWSNRSIFLDPIIQINWIG